MKPFTIAIPQSIWAVLAVLFALSIPFNTQAGPGHDHGDEVPATAGNASPRFVMSSELFEAVGIVKGKTIEIYVDHAQSNAPVEHATLELELNSKNVPVEPHATGEFDAVLPEDLIKGNPNSPISVALTIAAGDQVDLLAGELALTHSDDHSSEDHAHSHSFEFALYGVGGLMLLGFAVFGMRWVKGEQ